MFETIKWDGASPIDHEPIIKTALLSYITAEEKERAMTTSYGDLGEILKKNHGRSFHGGSYGEAIIQCDIKIVTVDITDLSIKYEMTWNKVAKAIHRWVHENAQPPAVSEDTALSDDYAEAVKLDMSIKTNAQAAQMHLYEVCKGLKEMRDGKLYKQLGYKNFEEYCEEEVGLKRRMAYKYAAVADLKNVQSTAHFGIEKLYLLSMLEEDQRTEIIENTDIESTSVRELKAQIKELTAERDESIRERTDIALKLDETLEKYEKSEKNREELCDENNKMSDRISELAAQVDELENRPIDVTYSETDSREVENMRKAMDEMDKKWRDKYDELQDSNITEIRSLNDKHNEELYILKSEYEKKIEIAVHDAKTTKKVDYRKMYEVYKKLFDDLWDEMDDLFFKMAKQERKCHVGEFLALVAERSEETRSF